ncbi:MAG TPA: MBL fold metallo-hydrolase [Myxococcota bacterium]|jgi:glyoxylase-like metal-dependent hydrolase (beta-lactamase superfamily II)
MTGAVAAREHRRAVVAAHAALEALETALALDRGDHIASATASLDKALAKPVLTDVDRAAVAARRTQLGHALASTLDQRAALAAYAREHGIGGVRAWTTSSGVRIYRISTESFPRHVNYVYAIDFGDELVLWDCGSGLHRARQMILDGFALVERAFGHRIAPADIDVILVSHGHYDHFGDAGWWKAAAQAPLWIHELDARVVENFAERTVLTGRDMAVWLAAAGCVDEEVRRLVAMYLESKEVYASVAVDRRLRHGQSFFHGRARAIHTPGHCPGHICLRIDEAILVADQVLAPVTPHLSPQALHPNNGLSRYLAGLGRLVLEDDVRLVLPAHYDDIPDLRSRIGEIADDHVDKLKKTMAICKSGATIVDVAGELFGAQEGYTVLLAILEAGTHVEYLHQLGALAVTDLDRVVAGLPHRYRATEHVHADAFGVELGGG